MAIGLREIRRRIRSVKNIQSITKAMEMVSAARLKRAQSNLFSERVYKEKIEEMVSLCSTSEKIKTHPLLTKTSEGKIGLVFITSDRGLCGSYNSNLFRQGIKFIDEIKKRNEDFIIFTIGRKGYNFFRREFKGKIGGHLEGKSQFEDVKNFFRKIIVSFSKKEFKEVYLIYTKFTSTTRHHITIEKILPFELKEKKQEEKYIFEPESEKLFENILPFYLESLFYQFYLETQCSEQASRMLAMQQANKNALEMIDSLTLISNKLRQAGITKEILEVVSGAEALK